MPTPNKLSLGAGKAVISLAKAPVTIHTPVPTGPAVDDLDPNTVEYIQPAAPTQNPSADKEGAEQLVTLSGVTKSGYAFGTLRVGQLVYLIPDPLGAGVGQPGRHTDLTAISVQDARSGGQHIGYIPAKTAKVYSNIFKEIPGVQTKAKIFKMKGGVEGFNWGVDIEIKFLEGSTQ